MLVRKIENEFWKEHVSGFNSNGFLAAQPLTNDMQTCDKNNISVWEYDDSNPDDLKRIILCLADSRSNLQNIDVVILRKHILEKNNVNITPDKGDSSFESYNELHRNLSNLSVDDMKSIISEMFYYLNTVKDSNENRYNKNKLINLFIEKIDNGELEKDVMSESVQRNIDRKLKIKSGQ